MSYRYKQINIPFVASSEVKEVILTGTTTERKRVLAIKTSNYYEGRDYDLLAYYEQTKIVDVPLIDIVKQPLTTADKKYPTEWINIDILLSEGEELSVGYRYDSTDEGDHRVIVKYQIE